MTRDAERDVLERVEAKELTRADKETEGSVEIVRRLYEAGYLDGAEASNFTVGFRLKSIRLTQAGVELLDQLRQEHYNSTPRGIAARLLARLGGHAENILVSVITAGITAWIVAKWVSG